MFEGPAKPGAYVLVGSLRKRARKKEKNDSLASKVTRRWATYQVACYYPVEFSPTSVMGVFYSLSPRWPDPLKSNHASKIRSIRAILPLGVTVGRRAGLVMMITPQKDGYLRVGLMPW